MRIQIGKLRISFFTVVVTAAVLYSDFSVFTIVVLVCALIHEAGHLAAMKFFGVNIYSVTVLPYGAVIHSDASLLPYKKEAAIALAGILFNIVTGVLSGAVWLFTRDIYTLFFAVCSFFLAFVNLVPVPTFDGARAIEAALSEKLNAEKTIYIMNTIHYFSFLFLVLGALYLLDITNGNFSLVMVLVYIFICVYAPKNEI